MQTDLLGFINKSRPYGLWIVLFIALCVLFYVLKQIDTIIIPFIIGFIGAYALNMPMQKLEGWGVPRSVGALLLILLVFSFIGLFIIWAVPFAKQELYALIKAYPKLQQKFLDYVMHYTKNISYLTGEFSVQKLQAQLSDSFGNILKWTIDFLISLLNSGFAIANILSLVILTPFVMFYFLKDWHFVIEHLNNLLPSFYAKDIRRECKKIDNVLSQYAYGQFLVTSTLIICYMITLWLIDLPYALFVGFFTGFLTFIPYLGVATGFLLALTISLTHFDNFYHVMMVVGVYAFFSSIESYFLTPKLVGGRIGLHPVLIIFSLMALGSWFGLIGIILALPLASIISTLTRSFLEWYTQTYVKNVIKPKREVK